MKEIKHLFYSGEVMYQSEQARLCCSNKQPPDFSDLQKQVYFFICATGSLWANCICLPLDCGIQEDGAVSIWDELIMMVEGKKLMNHELTFLPNATYTAFSTFHWPNQMPTFHWPYQVTWLNMILRGVEVKNFLSICGWWG